MQVLLLSRCSQANGPGDQKMTTVGKGVCYTLFPRGGTCYSMQGHSGQHQCWLGGRGSQGEAWAGVFIMVSTLRNG